MTRQEHIEWCKKRAIEEMDFYHDSSKAYISMASDLRKHSETNDSILIDLCIMQLLLNPKPSRQEAINFLNGFN